MTMLGYRSFARGPGPMYAQRDYRSYWDWIPRFLATFCGLAIRILLLVVVIINLAISATLVQRFTSVNGVTIPNATPPSPVIFSVVVSAVSLAYVLFSFCFVAVPVLLLVFDTIFFVAWFAASIILGISLNQTLRFSCQALAINVLGFAGGLGTFNVFSLASNRLAQSVFDSCNISKALFAFHIIATVMFTSTAASAAIAASVGNKAPTVNQQNNYYGARNVPVTRRGQAVPEIVV